MICNPEALVEEFISLISLTGDKLDRKQIKIEKLPAPHIQPKYLPEGKMAVYIFMWKDTCLKVGKASHQTEHRFTVQSYNPASAPSTLAKYLLNDPEMRQTVIAGKLPVKEWVTTNCERVNLLMDESLGKYFLNLLEAFIQYKLKPRYVMKDDD